MESTEVRNAPVDADRSIPELLQKLATQTTKLVRQEIELARAELMLTAKQAAGAGAAIGIAAVLALGAFGALTAAFIAALSLALPLWGAALIVAAVYGLIAVAAVMMARASLKKMRPPEQTIRTIKEDVAAVQVGIRRGR